MTATAIIINVIGKRDDRSKFRPGVQEQRGRAPSVEGGATVGPETRFDSCVRLSERCQNSSRNTTHASFRPEKTPAAHSLLQTNNVLTFPLPVELPLRYCRPLSRGPPPPGAENEELHEVWESRGEDVDGNRRDECLAGRGVPLDALGRFRRQSRRRGGVRGPEELVLSSLSALIVLLIMMMMVLL